MSSDLMDRLIRETVMDMMARGTLTVSINTYHKVQNKSDDTKKRIEIIKKRLMILMDIFDSKKDVLDDENYLTMMDNFKLLYDEVEQITNDNIDECEKEFKEKKEPEVMEIIKKYCYV